MKLKILFLALFVAGVAASIALASPSGSSVTTGTTATTTATTATTTGTTTTGRHGDGEHQNGQNGEHHGDNGKHGGTAGCRTVEVRGTAAAASIALSSVETSGKRARSLAATSLTLNLPAGPVRAKVRVCGDAAAGTQTLQLVELKVADGSNDG